MTFRPVHQDTSFKKGTGSNKGNPQHNPECKYEYHERHSKRGFAGAEC